MTTKKRKDEGEGPKAGPAVELRPKFSPEELALIREAARKDGGQKPTQWLRRLANLAAATAADVAEIGPGS